MCKSKSLIVAAKWFADRSRTSSVSGGEKTLRDRELSRLLFSRGDRYEEKVLTHVQLGPPPLSALEEEGPGI